jgi:uncharacterized protein (DUF58 family)
MNDTLFQAGKLASHLPGLLLEAEKVAHGFMKGVHGRRRAGSGETFWQFRPYAPGDSVRDIDWKQTAKRDTAFIRELEWEAAQALWLWRDASASMDFSSSKSIPTKRHYADVLLLALSLVALNGGEQVGLVGADMAPQAHAASIGRIAEALGRQDALAQTGRRIAPRSQAVLFGDFFFDLSLVSAFAAPLAGQGTCGLLVQICDPAEKDLPYKGRVRFDDPEGPGSLVVTKTEDVAAAYAEKFRAHQAALGALAGSLGWRFMSFSTADAPETALAALYDALAVK